MLAGMPGVALLGYDIVQIVFARGKDDPGAIDAVAVVFAIYSLFCLFFALQKYGENKAAFSRMLWHSPLKWFILYTAFGGVTCLWSANLPLTAFRAVECFSLMLLMVAVLIRLMRFGSIDVIIKWSIVYIFLMAFAKITQGAVAMGFEGALSPGSPFWYQPQFICPIFFYFAFLHTNNKFIQVFMIAVCLFAMSTAGYIAMAGGAIALLFGDKKARRIGILVFVAAGIYCMLYGYEDLLRHTVFIEHDAFAEGDDSGRGVIREIGWKAFHESPIVGSGFFVAENYISRMGHGMSVVGMHNGFMSALVGEGVVGCFFFVMFFVQMAFVAISKRMPIKYKAALLATFIAVFFETCGNPGLGFRIFNAWMPSMYACVLICALYCFHGRLQTKVTGRWKKKLDAI